jgi:mono/diheme cytochrome c family protein
MVHHDLWDCNGGALFGYTAAEPATGEVYVISQNNPGILRLLKPGETPANAPPGMTVYLRECQVCHAPDRSGTQNGPTLLDVPGRLDAATIRGTPGAAPLPKGYIAFALPQ